MQWTTVCFMLIVACLGGANSNRCVENLYNDVMQCFSDQGLDFIVEPGQQDANELMREAQAIDPKIQCQNIEVYKNAIGCALELLRNCLSQQGLSGALPDTDKFRLGMDVLCQKYEKFDYGCLKNKYMDILTCGQDTMRQIVKESTDNKKELSMEDAICTSADVNYDCSESHLRKCGNSTQVIYLEQLDKYQVPSACVSRSPGRTGRHRYGPSGSGAAASAGAPFAFTSLLISAAALSLLHWSGVL